MGGEEEGAAVVGGEETAAVSTAHADGLDLSEGGEEDGNVDGAEESEGSVSISGSSDEVGSSS